MKKKERLLKQSTVNFDTVCDTRRATIDCINKDDRRRHTRTHASLFIIIHHDDGRWVMTILCVLLARRKSINRIEYQSQHTVNGLLSVETAKTDC